MDDITFSDLDCFVGEGVIPKLNDIIKTIRIKTNFIKKR